MTEMEHETTFSGMRCLSNRVRLKPYSGESWNEEENECKERREQHVAEGFRRYLSNDVMEKEKIYVGEEVFGNNLMKEVDFFRFS
jgi:hypothetical protein